MTAFNLKTAKLGKGFTPGPMTVLVVKANGEPVVSYTSTYKGSEYFNIRSLWQSDDGAWNPGKGITMNPGEVAQFCHSVTGLSKPTIVKKLVGKVGKARKAG